MVGSLTPKQVTLKCNFTQKTCGDIRWKRLITLGRLGVPWESHRWEKAPSFYLEGGDFWVRQRPQP